MEVQVQQKSRGRKEQGGGRVAGHWPVWRKVLAEGLTLHSYCCVERCAQVCGHSERREQQRENSGHRWRPTLRARLLTRELTD
jgi:hypothetical protein